MSWPTWSGRLVPCRASVRQMIESAVVFGDPDEVGENMSSVLALGVDGLTCNLAANGHEPENVELLGETLTKVMPR